MSWDSGCVKIIFQCSTSGAFFFLFFFTEHSLPEVCVGVNNNFSIPTCEYLWLRVSQVWGCLLPWGRAWRKLWLTDVTTALLRWIIQEGSRGSCPFPLLLPPQFLLLYQSKWSLHPWRLFSLAFTVADTVTMLNLKVWASGNTNSPSSPVCSCSGQCAPLLSFRLVLDCF